MLILLLGTLTLLTAQLSPGAAPAASAKAVAAAGADQFPARKITFPSNSSFGDLFLITRRHNGQEWGRRNSRQKFADARGSVSVPAGSIVRLYVLYNGGLNVAPLANLKPNDIQSLDLSRVEMHRDTGRYLSHLTGLKELSASDTEAGDQFVHDLLPLQSLECLILNRTAVTDKGMEDIAKLNHLKILSLNADSIGEKGIAQLAKLKSLEALHLEKAKLTDQGLAALKSLPALRRLLINYTKISDNGLATIGQMHSLHYLEIAGTEVRGPGLAYLAGLHQLTGLQLTEGTVATHCISGLQKALPGCSVTYIEKRPTNDLLP